MTLGLSTLSCGIHNLIGLHERVSTSEDGPSRPEKTSFDTYILRWYQFPHRQAMVLFSDHVNFNGRTSLEALTHGSHRGPEFAKFLIDNKLGQVHTLPTAINPNTGHTIQLWAWYPDRDVAEKYAEQVLTRAQAEKKKQEKQKTLLWVAKVGNPVSLTTWRV